MKLSSQMSALGLLDIEQPAGKDLEALDELPALALGRLRSLEPRDPPVHALGQERGTRPRLDV
jgi:hypothetical protein